MRTFFPALASAAALTCACAEFGSGPGADTAADGGTSDGGAVDGGAAVDGGGLLRAFITGLSYPPPPNALAADTICMGEAQGRLSGTFVAWLPDGTTPAPARLVDRRGKPVDGPWFRADGKRLAANRAALSSTATTPFESPMGLTATSGTNGGGVWTFTLADGGIGVTCPNTGHPTVGAGNQLDRNWTDETFFQSSCMSQLALHCFQVE